MDLVNINFPISNSDRDNFDYPKVSEVGFGMVGQMVVGKSMPQEFIDYDSIADKYSLFYTEEGKTYETITYIGREPVIVEKAIPAIISKISTRLSIMAKVLKSLFPPSWNLTRDLKAVIEALSLSFERVRVFFSGVLTESNPGTAVLTQEEWHEQEGIDFDSTLSIEKQQSLSNQAYSTTGGQSPGYLNTQLQIAFPDVELQEVIIEPEFMVGFGMVGLMEVINYPSWLPVTYSAGEYPNFYFRVVGEVDDVADLTRISNLLSKIMPVPYEPVFAVTIRNLTPSGMVGLGMVGLMEVGRI